jgi:hypothetical protein
MTAMKQILSLILLVLCCACTKEKAVSTESLPSFLRSMKWTGVIIGANSQGEDVQWDTLTLYFVDDTLGFSRRHGAYLKTYTNPIGSPISTSLQEYNFGAEPFRYKAVDDRTVELLTYDGRSLRMELDQSGRMLHGDWESYPDLSGKDILPQDRESVNRARAGCGLCGPELFWKKSDNILLLKGKGPMFDYPSQEKVPWHDIGITAILMDEGITCIGNWAFAGLILKEHNILELKIPDSVSRIGDYAFYRCSPLPVSFKNVGNLVSIGEHAFEQSALAAFRAIGNLQTIGDYAFHDIPNLKLYFEGKSVKQIGTYAFTGFSSLSYISISSATSRIGTHAFEGDFRAIVLNGIPSRVDQDAFLPYNGNAILQVPFSTPPSVSGLPVNPREWTLQIPTGSKAAYQATSPWNQFTNIVEYSAP